MLISIDTGGLKIVLKLGGEVIKPMESEDSDNENVRDSTVIKLKLPVASPTVVSLCDINY